MICPFTGLLPNPDMPLRQDQTDRRRIVLEKNTQRTDIDEKIMGVGGDDDEEGESEDEDDNGERTRLEDNRSETKRRNTTQ